MFLPQTCIYDLALCRQCKRNVRYVWRDDFGCCVHCNKVVAARSDG